VPLLKGMVAVEVGSTAISIGDDFDCAEIRSSTLLATESPEEVLVSERRSEERTRAKGQDRNIKLLRHNFHFFQAERMSDHDL
jgi:hypothetical protein